MAHLKKSAITGHLLKNSGGHLVKACGVCLSGARPLPGACNTAPWAGFYTASYPGSISWGSCPLPATGTTVNTFAVLSYIGIDCGWQVFFSDVIAGYVSFEVDLYLIMFNGCWVWFLHYVFSTADASNTIEVVYTKNVTGPTDTPVGTYTLQKIWSPSMGFTDCVGASADATVTVSP